MSKLIVFDIETTGLYPERGDRIIEIGAVPIINNDIIFDEKFERLIDPEIKIPLEITKINHITDKMVKGSGKIQEILPDFLDYIDDYPLIAHNADFDVGFICYFINKLGLRKLRNRIIDTIALSKEVFPDERYHNLDILIKRLGIDFKEDQRHRAIEDVYLTALSFIKLRKML